ncbi:hypothetical protein J1N35_021826 [Gossypium stocksii]|uniref:Uncharacterized protein n=1 Tax=Gossypium stocksii TaxID=47602 RepID=A0A9D3VFA7_9ROSI|nr:hypothetical protein J1N35_021826 [Gossypium stocksii]
MRVQNEHVHYSFTDNRSQSLADLYERAHKFMERDDRQFRGYQGFCKHQGILSQSLRVQGGGQQRNYSQNESPRAFQRPQVEHTIRGLGILPSPPPIQHNQSRSNSRDRCNLHNDEGYKAEDCFTLKNTIEEVVRTGELKDFVAQDASISSQGSRGIDKGKQKVRGTIHIIIGTSEEWMTSNTKRKTHLRSVMSISSPKRLVNKKSKSLDVRSDERTCKPEAVEIIENL